MKRISLVKIYGWERKSSGVPGCVFHSASPKQEYRNVPIFKIGVTEMNRAVDLGDVDVIKKNRLAVHILTDGNRVLVVDSQGYDYARYKGITHMETIEEVRRLTR